MKLTTHFLKQLIREAIDEAHCSKRDDIEEGDKPDFLDLDKDGDKKEPMKDAAKDADDDDEEDPKVLEEAEYQGRKVTLNKPFRTPDGPKKSSVYVKNAKGNVVKVNFGDPNMEIKRDNPKRRKSFRARHNCKNPGPKWKARYWSCKAW
jgi:hypothetical protein